MKRFLFVSLCMLLSIAGCSSKAKGKIELTSIETAFQKIEVKDTFLLMISRASCSHCDDLDQVLKKAIKTKPIIIYNIKLDESSEEAFIADREKLAEKLDKPARTPHLYYIEKGVVKDEYIGFVKGDDHKFWDWIDQLHIIQEQNDKR